MEVAVSQPFVDTVQQEIAEEKAGALGLAGRRLEHALERFREHERQVAEQRCPPTLRERLLWDVAERVESFVVQREACGLRDTRQVLAFYGVPREAVARVGARRPSQR
jgi:hypothetical protein